MALQGTFVADFSSFQTACDNAVLKLRGFEDSSTKVTGQLNRMADSLSGVKIVQQAQLAVEAVERLGGASRLTENELQRVGAIAAEAAAKLRALGQDVSPQMEALAASVKKVTEPSIALSVALGNIASSVLLKASAAITDFGSQALLTSARVETLSSVAHFLGAQAGFSASGVDALVASLRAQGITSAQANDTIIQLTRANLSLADATKLATVAQSLARSTGQNSSETVNQLIHGIQTLQVETLRNAGVVIQLDQEYIKFSATHGRLVTSLGAEEKQQIALAAVLREGERVAGVYGITNQNVGGKIQSLARYQEEAAKSIGDVFLPVLRIGVEALTEFYKIVQKAPEVFAVVGVSMVGLATAFTAFKAASLAGVISTTTLTAALGLLGPAALLVGTAFASYKLGGIIGEFTGLTDVVTRVTGGVMGLSAAEIEATISARKFQDSAEGHAAAAANQAKALDQLQVSAKAAAAAQAVQAEANAKSLEAAKDAMEAAKKYAAALEEVQSAGEGWKGTLDTIDGAVAEGIKYYIEAGVSQDKLATFYGVTATQVRAVASALKEATAEGRLAESSIKELTKLQDRYNVIVAQEGTARDQQIAAIHRWYDDLTATLKKSGTYTAAIAAQMATDMGREIEHIGADWRALAATSQEALQQAYEKAQATLEEAESGSLHFSQAAIQHFRDVRDAALDAMRGITPGLKEAESEFELFNEKVMGIKTSFEGWNSAVMGVNDALDKNRQKQDAASAAKKKNAEMGNTIDSATAAQDPEINNYLKEGWSLKNAEALKMAKLYGFTPKLFDALGNPETAPSPGERVPGYAGGVMGAPGGLAMVGERGPELVQLPRGSNVIPFGGSGGGSVSFVNNFSISGADERSAKQMASIIMRQLKSQRQFGAA